MRNPVIAVGVLQLLVVLACLPEATASTPHIVPRPAEMQLKPGTFPFSKSVSISIDQNDAQIRPIATFLRDLLTDQLGYPISISTSTDLRGAPPYSNTLRISNTGSPSNDEAYELQVSRDSISLTASTHQGLFHGVQTIRQMLPVHAGDAPVQIPCAHIKDAPRYPWRGMLLDCCRHFMTTDFVKRYIDLLAFHKMNVLHWHITEDQGWRLEVKKYPKLTEIGAWRGSGEERYGGFYTQDEVREIVEYARSRFITVVPEIEMPGHSLAALASYPNLGCQGKGYEVGTMWGVHDHVYCAGNDEVFSFLEDVLSEVLELFPSKYIHIGGDECPKTQWKKCKKCQARIDAEGLKDEHELQSYFIRRIEKFLNNKGRQLIGWDEILEGGLAPNATVQAWRGMNYAITAASAGHDVIASPTSHCYLDYGQFRSESQPNWMGYISLERSYSFEPTPKELSPQQARHILGLEGNIWTERAPQDRVDWQVFPRLCALAEVGWSPKSRRNWKNFSERMQTHYHRLDALGVTYFLSPPICTSPERVFTNSTTLSLSNPMGRGVIRYTLDGSEPTSKSQKFVDSKQLSKSTVVKARIFMPNGRVSPVGEFNFRKMVMRTADHTEASRPGLQYKYYEGSWRKLPDFDQLTPIATGVAMELDVNPRKRDDEFALKFSGYISVPTNGTYTFYLTSDDGSRLWIGNELVVDFDGLHSASEISGQIILEKGKHPITVAQFEAWGAEVLNVAYEGPGIHKQPIPASRLTH